MERKEGKEGTREGRAREEEGGRLKDLGKEEGGKGEVQIAILPSHREKILNDSFSKV